GAVTALANFEAPPVEHITTTGDGGFAALTAQHERYTITNELLTFAPDGQRRWGKDVGNCSPHDLCLTSDGLLAINTLFDGVHLLKPEGQSVRKIDLQKSIGRKLSYPTDIAADADGG